MPAHGASLPLASHNCGSAVVALCLGHTLCVLLVCVWPQGDRRRLQDRQKHLSRLYSSTGAHMCLLERKEAASCIALPDTPAPPVLCHLRRQYALPVQLNCHPLRWLASRHGVCLYARALNSSTAAQSDLGCLVCSGTVSHDFRVANASHCRCVAGSELCRALQSRVCS